MSAYNFCSQSKRYSLQLWNTNAINYHATFKKPQGKMVRSLTIKNVTISSENIFPDLTYDNNMREPPIRDNKANTNLGIVFFFWKINGIIHWIKTKKIRK